MYLQAHNFLFLIGNHGIRLCAVFIGNILDFLFCILQLIFGDFTVFLERLEFFHSIPTDIPDCHLGFITVFLDGLADVGSPENPYADTFVMFWHEDEAKLQEALQECVESGGLPDWNNIPIGSPLMVRNSIDDPWIYAEFIGITDDGSFEVSFPFEASFPHDVSPAETHHYKYAKYLVE